MHHQIKTLVFIIAFLLTALLTSPNAEAIASKFRMEFTYNRRSGQLRAQEALIRANKDKIPAEIRGFIDDALSHKRTFEERMYLLDNAHALAKMYSVQFEDDTLLKQIRVIQDMEVAKEEQREEERKKQLSYRDLRGSFLMDKHALQIKAASLEPVVYPHWLHQIFFKCSTCHNETELTMTRGGNDITHEKFKDGLQCGACHDGSTAFAQEDNCKRCHMQSAQAEKLSYSAIDLVELNATAKRLGGSLKLDALAEAGLPLDRFGNIDWTLINEKGFITTAPTPAQDKSNESLIVFEATTEGMDSVLFSHKTHTKGIECASCHPSLFDKKEALTKVTMNELAIGKYCGSCHGRGAGFPLLDCKKCHNLKKGQIPEGAILRK